MYILIYIDFSINKSIVKNKKEKEKKQNIKNAKNKNITLGVFLDTNTTYWVEHLRRH